VKIGSASCRDAARHRFLALTRLQLEAAEIERELAMFTSRLASVTGFIGAAVLAATISVAAITAATPASAASSGDEVSIRVSVADLNMTSETGAREALTRIRRAANELCGGSEFRGSFAEQTERRSCVADTVKRAVAGSNLPTLMAVSQGQHVTKMASAAH
jgi:UrcA family protein